MKLTKCVLLAVTVLLSGSALFVSATEKETTRSDSDPTIRSWAKEYPLYEKMYMEMKDTSKPTEFGGTYPTASSFVFRSSPCFGRVMRLRLTLTKNVVTIIPKLINTRLSVMIKRF